jgi:hypothetical protein
VLEHVGFPRALVTEIFQAAPDNGLVFLEVPCEFPTGSARLLRRNAQIVIMTAYRPSLARHLLQPAALYMMHEHINYYTEHCLAELMSKSGGNVVASGTYPLDSRSGRANVAWCLGSKMPDNLSIRN